ncbi:MAG: nucleotidyltransferase family protein [Candidatus Aminicenantes bacterium]|nr:nucleotidyltransferase family protein [Candidatus Aminicenantes bacterium]
MIWTIILAAGESKRTAQPKLLLPFGEKTIIETVMDNAASSKANYSLLVTGGFQEQIKQKTKGFPAITVYNPNYKQGMLSSVQMGFQSLPEGAQAAIVLLGDQPSISFQVIDNIIDAYLLTPKGIILPTFKKERGHPVLFDMKYKGEIAALRPEVGLRGIVYGHPEDVHEVPVNTSSILRDIDNMQDYKRELLSRT